MYGCLKITDRHNIQSSSAPLLYRRERRKPCFIFTIAKTLSLSNYDSNWHYDKHVNQNYWDIPKDLSGIYCIINRGIICCADNSYTDLIVVCSTGRNEDRFCYFTRFIISDHFYAVTITVYHFILHVIP